MGQATKAARILLALLLAIGMMAPAAVPQRAHALQHRVQKTVLLFHFGRIIGVASMHIYGCHGDRVALRRFDIGFDPTP